MPECSSAPDAAAEELFRCRADALHRTVAPEIPSEQLFAAFERDYTRLVRAQKIELWFDYCIFDMSMLAELFYLLEHAKAEITLVLIDYRGKEFASLPQEHIAADFAVRKLYADLWRALCAGKFRDFAAQVKYFPHSGFETALCRYAEEFSRDRTENFRGIE